jgi:uncharacterized protein YkwD
MNVKWPVLCCLLLCQALAASAVPALPAAAVLDALNLYRRTQGLPALAAAPGLERLAEGHSAAMAGQGRLNHDGFAQRFDSSGGELCVENVAQGHRSAEQLIQGWRAVSTHHRNLLEPRVAFAGVGSRGRYVTFLACDVPGR